MPTLRIHHPVPEFDGWKKAFDDDPLGRSESGVRVHRVYRSVDDPNDVWIDLEFATQQEAGDMLERLRQLWERVQGEGLIGAPETQMLDDVDVAEY